MPEISQVIIFLVEDNRTNYMMYIDNVRFYARRMNNFYFQIKYMRF